MHGRYIEKKMPFGNLACIFRVQFHAMHLLHPQRCRLRHFKQPMKISFAICTHNEGASLRLLLTKLTEFIHADKPSGIEYEIVVLDDYSDNRETNDILTEFLPHISVHHHALNGDFGEHKNVMNSFCTGDWILNLDADEWMTDDFLGYMSMIIEANPNIDAYWIARVNTVEGLTLKHLQRWGWTITKEEQYRKIRVMDSTSDEYKLLKDFDHIISDEDGVVTYYEPIIAFPDFQMRLYKNDPKIKWTKKVHERLVGFNRYGMLPHEPILSIQHFKDIARQEQQNSLYEKIIT